MLALLGGTPIMDRYFNVAAMTSEEQFMRVCALEYLFQFLSVEAAASSV